MADEMEVVVEGEEENEEQNEEEEEEENRNKRTYHTTSSKFTYKEDDEDYTKISQQFHKQMHHFQRIFGRFEQSNDFAVGELAPQISNPGLYVEGLGLISLPLSETSALLLKSKCTEKYSGQSNCGLLEPTQISCANPSWSLHIEQLAKDCARVLGCTDTDEVSVSLCCLLLYEPGGQLNPNLPNKKEQGTFATLVVTLPSIFTGGRMVVRCCSEEREFDLATTNPYVAHYTAFFCDLPLEIEQVTSGYRLCLVYNLVLQDPSVDLPKPIAEKTIENDLAQVLREWALSNDLVPNRVIIPLRHYYNQPHLSFAHLKDQDQVLGQLFQRVARACDVIVSLATLTTLDTSANGKSTIYTNTINHGFPWESGTSTISNLEIVHAHLISTTKPTTCVVTLSEGEIYGDFEYNCTVLVVVPRVRLLGAKLQYAKSTKKTIKQLVDSFKIQREADTTAWEHFCQSVSKAIASIIISQPHENYMSKSLSSYRRLAVTELTKTMTGLGQLESFRGFLMTKDVFDNFEISDVADIIMLAVDQCSWPVVETQLREATMKRFNHRPFAVFQHLNKTAPSPDRFRSLTHQCLTDMLNSLPNDSISTPPEFKEPEKIFKELLTDSECNDHQVAQFFPYVSDVPYQFVEISQAIAEHRPTFARENSACKAFFMDAIETRADDPRSMLAFFQVFLDIGLNDLVELLIERCHNYGVLQLIYITQLFWRDSPHQLADQRLVPLFDLIEQRILQIITKSDSMCDAGIFAILFNRPRIFEDPKLQKYMAYQKTPFNLIAGMRSRHWNVNDFAALKSNMMFMKILRAAIRFVTTATQDPESLCMSDILIILASMQDTKVVQEMAEQISLSYTRSVISQAYKQVKNLTVITANLHIIQPLL